ncbi:MAG: glutamine--fructose-6-phosphate transaminase (isomerizing) [Chloroflexota bacterium]|nr:MAG: glutamine--fructose-6-phosphate transaminase (isomerizing) [Chloroflexota bacterium]
MCGIIGYIGGRSSTPILLEGLQQLEYRGYDSAGIAVLSPGGLIGIRKSVGKLHNLVSMVESDPVDGTLGIGHTRWATHGEPSKVNAHPQVDCRGDLVVIHNGIVENYLELKRRLVANGHVFASQTDTEVLPHLIEEELLCGVDLAEATRRALTKIAGSHAVVVLSRHEPERIITARIGNAGGVVVGYGEGEMFIASDLPAILKHTRSMAFLENREMAAIERNGVTYYSLDGTRTQKSPQAVPYDPISAAKGGYRHYMLKEIMEQPRSVTDAIRGRVSFEPPSVLLEDLPFSETELRDLRKVTIVACGTSWHAGLVGKYMIEQLAHLPVEVDYASEFRYRHALIDESTLLVSITQSGETVDTLAAMELAKERHVKQITICNVIGSQATRLADGVIYLRAGPEIGVASTKAFTSQVVVLYLLGIYLGQARGTIAQSDLGNLVDDLAHLPDLIGTLLSKDNHYEALADQLYTAHDCLYLGRGINYPIALEGALKLKEISYIHAEGYPAGEMKHGPIALIDRDLPIIAIAPRDGVYDKMVSNIEQVKSRHGTVIALATEGDSNLDAKADHVIHIPQTTSSLLTPVLTIIPLQLLAYHMAIRRGCDVDQPRNLAKSVTVE